jgi:hypothetical protein
MKTATVTYVCPKGDNKAVEFGGLTFFDGKPVEINSSDNPHLFSKLQGNQHFDFEMGEDEPDVVKPKRGRPSNAEKAAEEKKVADAKAAAEKAAADAKAAVDKKAAEDRAKQQAVV